MLHAQGAGASTSLPFAIEVSSPPVSNPDFAFSAPTELTGVAGDTVQVVYTLTPVDGFQGPVTITASSQDGRIAATDTVVNLTTGGSKAALATLAIGSGDPGQEEVAFSATSGDLAHTVKSTVDIASAVAPGVDLTVSPAEVAVVPDTAASVLLTLTSVGGYDGPVGVRAVDPTSSLQGDDLPPLAVHPGAPTLQSMDIVVPNGSWLGTADHLAKLQVWPVAADGTPPPLGPTQTVIAHRLPGRKKYQFSLGGPVEAAALGDLDGDGKPDLIVARDVPGSGTSMEVRLGQGSGRFAATSQTLGLPGRVSALALADVDGDGTLDLIAAGTDLNVFPGDGTGRLQATPVTTQLAAPAQHLSVADLDGDGHVDVAVTEDQSATVEVGFGVAGSSTFALKDFSSPAYPKPADVAAMGSTGSGGVVDFVDTSAETVVGLSVKPDRTISISGGGAVTSAFTRLFTVKRPGTGAAFLVDTDGYTVNLHGSSPQSLHFGRLPRLVAGADLDRDGRLDLVSANSDGSIQVRMSSTSGGWLPPAASVGSGDPLALFIAALTDPTPPALPVAMSSSSRPAGR